MPTILSLQPKNGGPFNCAPGREISDLSDSQILCNNIVFPWEFNPHKVRLFVIGNVYGSVAAVWSDCEQDAFSELIDSGLGDSFLVSADDQDSATEEGRDEWARLGNAGEPCDLNDAWIQEVRLSEQDDCRLLCAFAEARGNLQATLEKNERNLSA